MGILFKILIKLNFVQFSDFFSQFENLVCVYLAKLVFVKPYNSLQNKDKYTIEIVSIDELDFKNHKKDETESKKKMVEILRNIQKYVNLIWDKVNEDKIKENIKYKWHHAALVMDRLFFFISFIYFVTSFSLIILSNKNFYKPV